MVSTVGNGGFIGQVLKGFGISRQAEEPRTATRPQDTVTLSPQSLAMQETIRQNGEAAASVLGEGDSLAAETASGLNLIA